MHMLCITNRPEAFVELCVSLAQGGLETRLAATGEAGLRQARRDPPILAVVDETLPDATAFDLVARIMRVNAGIQTAVVSGLSPEAFHEAGEGLGILTALPERPTARDAEALLGRLSALA